MIPRQVRAAFYVPFAAAVAAALAACTSAAATPSATVQTTPQATSEATASPSQAPAASLPAGAPGWLSMELTDVTTGEKFTIAGLGSDVVLVQNMAQWCPTCRSQAGEVKKVAEAFGEEGGLSIVSLDVDPNEDAASLKAYVAKEGFGWHFAVAPADLLREIDDLYGTQYLNPPSAPMLLVKADGSVLPLSTGIKSAEKLQETIIGFLGL
jgi:thiol-disulfide isomerase/thioredoxin